jgi:hypothetical protein
MMTFIKKLSPRRNKKERKSQTPTHYPFGISNEEQDAYLASHRRRTLQLLPPPIVIARNPKPNSSESHQPRIVFHDEIPDFRLPAFRYLKFDKQK